MKKPYRFFILDLNSKETLWETNIPPRFYELHEPVYNRKTRQYEDVQVREAYQDLRYEARLRLFNYLERKGLNEEQKIFYKNAEDYHYEEFTHPVEAAWMGVEREYETSLVIGQTKDSYVTEIRPSGYGIWRDKELKFPLYLGFHKSRLLAFKNQFELW